MPFQFYCPGGHLLEGTESQMGQQCQCPICSVAFIVPTVGGAPPAPAAVVPAPYVPPMPSAPAASPVVPPIGLAAMNAAGPAAPELPAIVTDPAAPVADDKSKAAAREDKPAKPAQEEKPAEDPNRIVRIPCPQGHELETPLSMVGMDALCPHCGEQFTLLYENSIEYREEQALKRQRREEQFTRRLVKWSIIGGVVILLAFIVLIVVAATR